MIELIRRLNQNKFFRFVSSIRLAVPVMLTLITSVAAGTIFESNYSAEYAKIAVYDTLWFNGILGLLALNIFASMMSRYPWQKRHIGFVTTHIGILILLFGSFLTKTLGVDGSLQIREGESANLVILPDLMVGYQYDNSPTFISVSFKKTLKEQTASDLSAINSAIGHVVQVERFVPFAELERSYEGGESDSNSQAIGIGFQMKSKFFDVKEWLHTEDQPVMQLGPATLKIIIDAASGSLTPTMGKRSTASATERATANSTENATENSKEPKKIEINKNVNKNSEKTLLMIKDFSTGKVLKKVSLLELKKGVEIKGARVELTHAFQRAIVSENKLVESLDPGAAENAALELKIKKGTESKREVLYAKFPQFSLNKDGSFGLAFEMQGGGGESSSPTNLPSGHPQIGAGVHAQGGEGEKNSEMTANEVANPTPSLGGGGPNNNVIEFHVARNDLSKVRVELWKAGKKIEEKIMKEGDIFQTPWMGMQLYLASIVAKSTASVDVRAVQPKAGAKVLPNSAVLVRPLGAEKAFWLSQGDSKAVQIAGRPATVVFANNSLKLPFSLKLLKFTKKDYPGTETPYSYESFVRDEDSQKETLISMNEPLKMKDYTLYQASFSMTPGEPPTSVLSVNQDPGRWVKYLGSIILSLGIITFTLMKSRLNPNKAKGSVA